MNRKYLTLIGVLGFSLLCLNLSAATSYKITEAEAGSDSFKIFSSNLTNSFGYDRPRIKLNVGNWSKWLSFNELSETNNIIAAGITFQKDNSVSFSRGTVADFFGPYSINTIERGQAGFKDYGIDSYFQLSGLTSGNTLDFQFAKTTTGEGGGNQGGPLPGVLATLLLGGGSAWVLKKRKKASVK